VTYGPGINSTRAILTSWTDSMGSYASENSRIRWARRFCQPTVRAYRSRTLQRRWLFQRVRVDVGGPFEIFHLQTLIHLHRLRKEIWPLPKLGRCGRRGFFGLIRLSTGPPAIRTTALKDGLGGAVRSIGLC